MSDLTTAMAKVEGEQAADLRWFQENAGKAVSWSLIKEHADHGARLVTQAKGIYKPRYTDYALSVRQTLDSPYADKEVVRRLDESWVYPYFQENSDPAERDREATNRGLVKCMNDGVPVGVLLQVKPKPGVEYDVLGLAAVVEWKGGYFILEGFSHEGDEFNPLEVDDSRERQIAEVVRRRGQAKFRAALVAAYQGKCVVTGCDAIDALEAAHRSPYRGAQTTHLQNGLLLRADLHTLFDLGMKAIDSLTNKVVIADAFVATSYADLAGRAVAGPIDPSYAPSREALAQHFKWTGIKLPDRQVGDKRRGGNDDDAD